MSDTIASTLAVAPAPSHPRSRRRLLLRTIVGLAVLLVIVRLLLPWLLARAINDRLGSLPLHQGVVDDVDLHLFRGAYRIHGLSIRQRGEHGDPLISVRTIDFSLAWRELFHGRVVSDIVFDAPILRLTRASPLPPLPPGEKPPTTNDPGWRALIEDLFPIEITALVIREGSIDYDDPARDPPLAIGIADVGARIEGLANRTPPKGEPSPARGELAAIVEGGGGLSIQARGFPLADPPVFEARAELDAIPLPAINPLLRSSLGVDVSDGTLHLAVEIHAAGGSYEGYVKPLVRGARFTDIGHEPGAGPAKTLWETLVAGVAMILTNDNSENLGSRVPFAGQFGRTDVDAWDAFVALLRNAFVRALREGVDPGAPMFEG
jgi:hypothetical protein